MGVLFGLWMAARKWIPGGAGPLARFFEALARTVDALVVDDGVFVWRGGETWLQVYARVRAITPVGDPAVIYASPNAILTIPPPPGPPGSRWDVRLVKIIGTVYGSALRPAKGLSTLTIADGTQFLGGLQLENFIVALPAKLTKPVLVDTGTPEPTILQLVNVAMTTPTDATSSPFYLATKGYSAYLSHSGVQQGNGGAGTAFIAQPGSVSNQGQLCLSDGSGLDIKTLQSSDANPTNFACVVDATASDLTQVPVAPATTSATFLGIATNLRFNANPSVWAATIPGNAGDALSRLASYAQELGYLGAGVAILDAASPAQATVAFAPATATTKYLVCYFGATVSPAAPGPHVVSQVVGTSFTIQSGNGDNSPVLWFAFDPTVTKVP